MEDAVFKRYNPSWLFQCWVMQSHSHLVGYKHRQKHMPPPTQSQFPIRSLYAPRNTLRCHCPPQTHVQWTCRHTLKLMDTFHLTETWSLCPHTGMQSYTHTRHSHSGVQLPQSPEAQCSHTPTLPTRSPGNSSGDKTFSSRSCCCKPQAWGSGPHKTRTREQQLHHAQDSWGPPS